jgi:hypothetical protein
MAGGISARREIAPARPSFPSARMTSLAMVKWEMRAPPLSATSVATAASPLSTSTSVTGSVIRGQRAILAKCA